MSSRDSPSSKEGKSRKTSGSSPPQTSKSGTPNRKTRPNSKGKKRNTDSPTSSLPEVESTLDKEETDDDPFGFSEKPPTPKKVETPEEKEARIAKEKEERRLKFIRDNYTFLTFKYLDGSERVLQLDRITSYMDLQVQIARYNPGKKMFIVLSPPKEGEDKVRISSDNFIEGPAWSVLETFVSNIPKFLPRLPTQWDFLKYHGKPENWVDPVIRKRIEKEAQIKREAEEKMKEEMALEAEATAKAERLAAEQQANEEWADLLGDL
jgi:hypothetical protein